MNAIRNIAGNPVEGASFFGRSADIRRLIDLLQDHDVLLLGSRRIGKTSIARAVMANLRQQGWEAIEVNVAACKNEAQFINRLVDKLDPILSTLLQNLKGAAADMCGKIMQRIKGISLSVPTIAKAQVDFQSPDVED